MADTAGSIDSKNAAFWLPSHFLTDDDFLAEDGISHRTTSFQKKDNIDYNYDSSFGLDPHTSLDSPVSSTGTERGDSNNEDRHNFNEDDEDFLTELTRHLARSSLLDPPNSNFEKSWMYSTSPQSTLTGFGPWTTRSGFSSNGSPNAPSPRVPSPPVTHEKNDAAWELLYEAAGQVARLKMNALAAQANHHLHQQNRGLLGAPRKVSLPSASHHHRHLSSYDFPHPTSEYQYEQVKRQASGNFYCQHNHNHHQPRRSLVGEPLGTLHSAWPMRQNPQRQLPGVRSVFLNRHGPGSMPGGLKRQSTGTGVFLPRRAGTTQPLPEPRKKPSMVLPARVVEAFNRDLEEMNSRVNPASNSRFGSGLLSDHETIMGRRNAMLEQRRNMLKNEGAASMVGVGPEIRLPSDWTY